MKVEREFVFEAAHVLPRHPGKCSQLHGHSWHVVVELEGEIQPETGFVMDFTVLKSLVQPYINRFDHKLLNCFVRYPSSENIAVHLAHQLRARIPDDFEIHGLKVTVSETAGTRATFDIKSPADLYMLDHGAEDAEWRSPDIVGIKDIPSAISQAETVLPDLWKQYLGALIVKEQLQMYLEMLDEDPVLPLEVKGQSNAGMVGQG